MRLIIHFPRQPSFTIDMVEEPHKDSNNDPSFLEDSHLVTPSSNNLTTIFWYSSYDSRTGDPGNKGLWSEPEAFGERAHFRVSQSPAVLSIRNLTKEDGGVYTCRSGIRIDSFREFSLHLLILRCFRQYNRETSQNVENWIEKELQIIFSSSSQLSCYLVISVQPRNLLTGDSSEYAKVQIFKMPFWRILSPLLTRSLMQLVQLTENPKWNQQKKIIQFLL